MTISLYEIQEKIHYQFIDSKLLITALTHSSAASEHNERLEYLGDGILNAIIADILYHRFPNLREGELSRLRATLVSGETLATLAKQFELGQYLHLGPGEIQSGGAARTSILSCALEAIIGAIYLDAGYLTTQKMIQLWYQSLLNHLIEPEKLKDPKTQLQEFLQAKHLDLPIYEIVATTGKAHERQFTVVCKILNKQVSATGASRRKAEQAAASAMLKCIQKNDLK